MNPDPRRFTLAKALYNFDPDQFQDDELKVTEGEDMEVLEHRDDGWSTVRVRNKLGLVPSSYLQDLGTFELDSDSFSSTTGSPSTGSPPSAHSSLSLQTANDSRQQPHRDLTDSEKAQLARFLRFWNVRRRLHLLVTKDESLAGGRQRNKIMKEILASELSYVRSLEILVNVFMQPIRNSKIVDEKTFKTIFGNVEQILSINRVLLKGLEEALRSFPSQKAQVGDCFLKLAPFLKVYTVYVNNYVDAIQLLSRKISKKKRGKFVLFLEKLHSDHKEEIGNLSLASYLIMPVQRIPRYRLLLQDYLNHTPPEHVEYSVLQGALDSIKTVANFVNERKRQVENTAVVIRLQKVLQDRMDIIQPHRKFVFEGQIQFTCTAMRIESSTWWDAYLFTDILVLVRSMGGPPSTTVASPIIIYLAFSNLVSNDKSPANFIIEACQKQPFGRVALEFVTQSADDKALWVDHLAQCYNEIATVLKLRGVVGDDLHVKRTTLDTSIVAKKKEFAASCVAFRDAEKKLSIVEKSLRAHEDQLRKLQDQMKKESQAVEEAEAEVNEIIAKERELETDLQQHENSLKKLDGHLLQLLRKDLDAFRHVFGSNTTCIPEEPEEAAAAAASKNARNPTLRTSPNRNNEPPVSQPDTGAASAPSGPNVPVSSPKEEKRQPPPPSIRRPAPPPPPPAAVSTPASQQVQIPPLTQQQADSSINTQSSAPPKRDLPSLPTPRSRSATTVPATPLPSRPSLPPENTTDALPSKTSQPAKPLPSLPPKRPQP